MWWRRILTLAATILAIALTLSALQQIIVEADAAEVTPEVQIVETESATAETEVEELNYDLIEYEELNYKIPHLSLNREPGVTESGYVEKYTEVPHYFQSYYPHVAYGNSNIRRSGCGVACVSMVLTYLLDEEVTIEELAKKYFLCKVEGGSSNTLFTYSARDYGVTIVKQANNWEEVMEALKNGHVAIGTANSKSLFTNGGHFIVLAGITEEGKILVRDPNLYNYSIWNYPDREQGYLYGFEENSLKYNCFPFYIYEKKDLEAVTARNENEAQHATITEVNENI